MPKKVRPIPKGYHSVTAQFNVKNAAATIAFCKKAFGAKLLMKMGGPGGAIMHAEVLIGDSIIMLGDAVIEAERLVNVFLYVPDVDKVFRRAVKAGATVRMAPTDMFWGDRFARVEDPQGNRWGMATHIEDVAPKEMKKRAAAFAKEMAAQQKAKPSGG